MSCSTTPPQPCTAWFTSSRAPRLVMTIGTWYLAQTAMSCSSRSLLLCTIWLMAKGAAGCSGWARSWAARVSVISASQSSSCAAGRALSAGMEPTMPALHCAITSCGLLMMNSGEPITGKVSFCKTGGKRDMACLQQVLDIKKSRRACLASASSSHFSSEIQPTRAAGLGLRTRPVPRPSRWRRLRRCCRAGCRS